MSKTLSSDFRRPGLDYGRPNTRYIENNLYPGENMKRTDVHLQFSGTVAILVPGHLAANDARLLANKLALARILATTDNPDASEDDACQDYAEECSEKAQATAAEDWDSCEVQGVGGKWVLRGRR
jgi:hypothetical protein